MKYATDTFESAGIGITSTHRSNTTSFRNRTLLLPIQLNKLCLTLHAGNQFFFAASKANTQGSAVLPLATSVHRAAETKLISRESYATHQLFGNISRSGTSFDNFNTSNQIEHLKVHRVKEQDDFTKATGSSSSFLYYKIVAAL